MAWLRLDADFAEHPHVAPGGWRARVAWVLVLTVVKRYGSGGVLDAGASDPDYLAALWGLAPDDVRAGLDSLVRRGAVLRGDDGGLAVPSWDRYQIDPRPPGRTRVARVVPGTHRDAQGQTGTSPRTGRDGTGRDGTIPEGSPSDSLSGSHPTAAVPPDGGGGPGPSPPPSPVAVTRRKTAADADALAERAEYVLAAINRITGKRYRPVPATLAPIIARMKGPDGDRPRVLVAVAMCMWAKWGEDAKQREYVRPSTLFRPSNFENYRTQAAAHPRWEEQALALLERLKAEVAAARAAEGGEHGDDATA